jgi:carboxymethylenebutenolidase
MVHGELGRSWPVTVAIAQFLIQLERTWNDHQDALLRQRDLDAVFATLAPEPSVQNMPAGTGAAGADAVRRFYAREFLPYLPADLAVTRISRTVDRWRLVDEATVSFTHDRELPWLLPGVEPTGRRAEVLAITVVAFERRRVRSVRTLWDHATLTAQLGLPALAAAG